VLQFVDFVSQLMRGGIEEWLSDRHWQANDLKSKLLPQRSIDFSIHFQDDRGDDAGSWMGTFNPSKLRCVKERLTLTDYIFEADDKSMKLRTVGTQIAPADPLWEHEIRFEFEGSILSQLKKESLPESIQAVHTMLDWTTSLDLLSPQFLRQRTRFAPGSVGRKGEHLAAFFHDLPQMQQLQLTKLLRQVYPQLEDIETQSLRSGWKRLDIQEWFESYNTGVMPIRMRTEARHVNDGLLRMLAILAELCSGSRFLLFDEIENGINPELIQFLVQQLVAAQQQVLVTTHSPMVLNYLNDEIAKTSVMYLYKLKDGQTRSIPFFDIPSVLEKLEVMGPGEAFVDTKLTRLVDEIDAMSNEGR
jgi:hypothetical protein